MSINSPLAVYTEEYPETDYGSLEFKARWSSLTVYSKDIDGTVDIDLDANNETGSMHFSQEELKLLVEFLQKQLL